MTGIVVIFLGGVIVIGGAIVLCVGFDRVLSIWRSR
jgi:hypothetical protein